MSKKPQLGTIPVRCAYDRLEPLAKLKPHPRNPNKHPEAQVALLAKILQAQGWRLPIVVSKRSGLIVCGHARPQAALSLGLERGPVNYQEFESEEQELAHLVADNKIAELAETDDATLKALIKELGETDLDLALLGMGEDLQRILDEMNPQEADDEHAAELIDKAAELQRKWKTKRGQVWELGEHRLMCGDSLRRLDVERVVYFPHQEPLSLIVTSPPYNQKIDSFAPSGMHKEGEWVSKVQSLAYADNLPETDYREQQRGMLELWAYRSMVNDG